MVVQQSKQGQQERENEWMFVVLLYLYSHSIPQFSHSSSVSTVAGAVPKEVPHLTEPDKRLPDWANGYHRYLITQGRGCLSPIHCHQSATRVCSLALVLFNGLSGPKPVGEAGSQEFFPLKCWWVDFSQKQLDLKFHDSLVAFVSQWPLSIQNYFVHLEFSSFLGKMVILRFRGCFLSCADMFTHLWRILLFSEILLSPSGMSRPSPRGPQSRWDFNPTPGQLSPGIPLHLMKAFSAW